MLNLRRLALIISLSLISGCSLLMPKPDKLLVDMVAPLPAGERFELLDVATEPGDYSRREHFVGDFAGNDIELLAHIEKADNTLIFVASAPAGQPIFALKQVGAQLHIDDRYFDLKGLKLSWLLADYQFVHMPLTALNQALVGTDLMVVEHRYMNRTMRLVLDKALVAKQTAKQGVISMAQQESAFLRIDYIYSVLNPEGSNQADQKPQFETIRVQNVQRRYRYTIRNLSYLDESLL